MEISVTSLGSSQILRWPQFRTCERGGERGREERGREEGRRQSGERRELPASAAWGLWALPPLRAIKDRASRSRMDWAWRALGPAPGAAVPWVRGTMAAAPPPARGDRVCALSPPATSHPSLHVRRQEGGRADRGFTHRRGQALLQAQGRHGERGVFRRGVERSKRKVKSMAKRACLWSTLSPPSLPFRGGSPADTGTPRSRPPTHRLRRQGVSPPS